MTYHFSKTVQGDYNAIVDLVTAALKTQGFGILTDIDVAATLKKKLDVDIRKYRILGACNPQLAYQALQVEDKIGTMLPCNVIVQESDAGIEVSAVDPAASMQAVDNPKLKEVAQNVRVKMKAVIDTL